MQRGVAFSGAGNPEAGMGVPSAISPATAACRCMITHIRNEKNTVYMPVGNGLVCRQVGRRRHGPDRHALHRLGLRFRRFRQRRQSRRRRRERPRGARAGRSACEAGKILESPTRNRICCSAAMATGISRTSLPQGEISPGMSNDARIVQRFETMPIRPLFSKSPKANPRRAFDVPGEITPASCHFVKCPLPIAAEQQIRLGVGVPEFTQLRPRVDRPAHARGRWPRRRRDCRRCRNRRPAAPAGVGQVDRRHAGSRRLVGIYPLADRHVYGVLFVADMRDQQRRAGRRWQCRRSTRPSRLRDRRPR